MPLSDEDLRRRLATPVVPLLAPDRTFQRIARAAVRRRRMRATLTAAAGLSLITATAVVGVVLGRHPASSGQLRLTAEPSIGATAPATAPSPTVIPTPLGGPVPARLRLLDLTWIRLERGWALAVGAPPCATRYCTSIVRTSDGGGHWVGIPAPVAGVTHLRFADDLHGYAYGPGLYATDDGGTTWQPVDPGGPVSALEVEGGTAILVSCDTECALKWAPVGSTGFATVARVPGSAASLVRDGPGTAYLATGTRLLRSADGGRSWTGLTSPCGTTPLTAVAAAPPRQLAVLCGRRVFGSVDAGRSFGPPLAAPTGGVELADPGGLPVVATRAIVFAYDGHAFRVAYRGRQLSGLGFEDDDVGRIIDGTTTMVTSLDGGRHWIVVSTFS